MTSSNFDPVLMMKQVSFEFSGYDTIIYNPLLLFFVVIIYPKLVIARSLLHVSGALSSHRNIFTVSHPAGTMK